MTNERFEITESIFLSKLDNETAIEQKAFHYLCKLADVVVDNVDHISFKLTFYDDTEISGTNMLSFISMMRTMHNGTFYKSKNELRKCEGWVRYKNLNTD